MVATTAGWRIRRALAVLAVWSAAASAAPAAEISGAVRHHDSGAAVAGVAVAVSGSAAMSAISGADGGWSLAAPLAGDWYIEPAKLGGVNGAVDAADAACALDAATGARPSGDLLALATDVTGDGRVTALDAARILQVALGLRARLPIAERCDSDWAFVPDPAAAAHQQTWAPRTAADCAPGAIALAPLTAPAADQDFLAVAFGDCTADWQPGLRDWRTWPFTRRSPWNHPIGSEAAYVAVPQLAQLPIGINYDDRWTCAVAVASAEDPLAAIRFGDSWGPHNMLEFLVDGGQVCGNTAEDEAALLAHAAGTMPPTAANFYSTCSTADDSLWVLPESFHPADADWRGVVHLPDGTCASPDTDALLAVMQPDGWVLDAYGAVVTADHQLVAAMASWIDARGDGTGWWNGRRASLLPSFAGLIRNGEITAGRIPHALAALAPTTLLGRGVQWPAATIDRNSGYSGSLPMGALLAIPASVDLATLGLSPRGLVLARAAQDYGIYVVDRGGSGLTLLAELGNTEIRWERDGDAPPAWKDLLIIRDHLQWVANNGPERRGGGGTPRRALAPPVWEGDE